jgi:sugar-specific transcriptional regulator TrmB
MPDDKISLEAFLDEMVAALDKRLRQHERDIKNLEREIASLGSKTGIKVDRSVLKVLRGK